MSGWAAKDRKLAEDVGDDFPAMNNITIRGALPSDQVPAASKCQATRMYNPLFLQPDQEHSQRHISKA